MAERARLRLCVGLTGTRSSTKAMVDGVAALRARQPAEVTAVVAGITELVGEAIVAASADDMPSLGRCLDKNQQLLRRLELSTDAIEQMCGAARGSGALGAKLTGAGGGGAVVALAGADDEAGAEVARDVVTAWRGLGYEGFDVRLGFDERGCAR